MAAIAFAAFFGAGLAGLVGADEGKALADARRRLVVPVPPVESPGMLRWRADWDEAVEEARRRNCPILIVYSDDQSAGLASVETTVHSKPPFVEMSREVVLLIALDGSSHKSTPRDVDGEKVAWCGRFDVPCDAHRKLHEFVKERFISREFWNPLHLFLDGDGNELGRTEGNEVDQARLDRELGKARRRLGPSIAPADYAALMKKLKTIVDGREKGAAAADAELAQLVAAQERAADAPAKGPLRTKGMADYVKELRARLEVEGDAFVKVAEAKARGGDVAGARALLDNVIRSYRDLPPGKYAKEALDRLKQ